VTCAAPSRPSGSRRAPGLADAAFLARSATDALHPLALVPVWAWILLAAPILRIAGRLPGGILLGIAGLLVWAFVAARVSWKLRTGEAPPVAGPARSVARALPDIFIAPLGTVSVPAFFLVLAAVGCLVGLIPIVGTALLVLWLATGGLVLVLLGAYWLFFAITAAPIQVAMATAGSGRTRMEILAESLGKVRRAPLRVLLGWGIVAACASGAAALAAGALLAAAAMVDGAGSAVRQGSLGIWAPWIDPPADMPVALTALARLAPAVLVATLFAGSARLDRILEEES
jgi:hypothetical protein